MSEFLKLVFPVEALDVLIASLPVQEPACEFVDTLTGLGRVTSRDILAPQPLPAFTRSTMDGYAVQAADTFGASESMPGYLTLCETVPMGTAPSFSVEAGQAAVIHTGGMLPLHADSVIPLEQTQRLPSEEIEVLRAVAPGENTLSVGEDVRAGQVVIPGGTRLRPVEIGGCMALGLTRLEVAVRPKIGIISSGDEIIPPEADFGPGQVRDVNSYTLAALVSEAGGEPVLFGIIPDRLDRLKEAIDRALSTCQAVVITAGSSASARDMTAAAIGASGQPGVLIHGVNVRPGKPTILGVCHGKAVIGLPGNPVSALVIAGLFAVPVIHRLLGQKLDRPRSVTQARLTINIPSQAGREDWVPVKLTHTQDRDDVGSWLAEPIFAKSNLIFSLSAADGLLRIPADVTGFSAGELVQVFLL